MQDATKLSFTAALLAFSMWTPSAFADEGMNQCVSAYETAQTLQREGKYVAALDQAKICAQSNCGILVNECIKMYEDLKRDAPTFVFSAQNGDGGEIVDVKVSVDGALVFEKLEGTALTLDPGAHTFKFEVPGEAPVEVNHIARVGDRHRLIQVTIGKKTKADVPPPQGPPLGATEPQPKPEPKGVPTATWVLGGVGVLSLGAFTYLRVSGVADYNSLNKKCSPYCNPTEVDDIRAKFTASYIAGGIAAGALAGAAIIYFTSRSSSQEAVQASVMPLPGGGGANILKRF